MKKAKKKGRGRPSITGETGERYQVTIPPRVAKTWRNVGNGSLSAGVSRNPSEFRRARLREDIRSNERQIEMLESGKMTLGFGAPLGTLAEAKKAALRLRMANEELEVLLQYDEAFERWQRAMNEVTGQFWPRGNGQPSQKSIDESEAAHAALKAAEAARDRIMQEIRAGKRR